MADKEMKLVKYVETIDDKLVSPLNENIEDNLKSKYAPSASTSYQLLMEEVKKIHLNQ